jgi:hypothetical protein
MSDNVEKAAEVTHNIHGRSIIPFTGGLIIFVYAWFWPEGYGRWVGTIVRAFRDASGI